MQAFWDSQLKFSSFVPDFAQLVENMHTQSDVVAETHGSTRSAYGPDQRQWVEWLAGTGSDATLPVVIHGGYWRAMTAEMHRFMLPGFAAHGCAVANVEYRLIPEVRLSDIVADVTRALTHLAAEFPKAQLILIGHSAGAHLALSAMVDDALKARTDGILALSGVYDLTPVAHSFLQAELTLTPQEIDDFMLRPAPDRPATLYVNGSAETPEFLRGSAVM